MPTSAADRAALEKRYQEKLRARAEGRTPVIETPPVVDPSDTSPAGIEARYRQKLALHGAQRPVPSSEPPSKPTDPEPKVESKPEPKEGKSVDSKPPDLEPNYIRHDKHRGAERRGG